jgi:hypothetical protein
MTLDEKKGKVILLGSESVGRGDETLGFEILMTMLNRLEKRTDKPRAIVFWNTAVKLLADDSPALPALRLLEQEGIEILAGQLCLDDLCIAGQVSIGKPATMDEILDLLLHNDVVSL